MKALNRSQRVQQVLNWIDYEWPIGRPVVIRWRAKLEGDCAGMTCRDGKSLVIYLSKKRNRTWHDSVDTLIHEAAHCILWGMASVEDRTAHHPPSFWSLYGEIRDRFDHDHGAEESEDFSTERGNV